MSPELVRGAGKERLRAGLVGCGGRGTEAAFDLLAADPGAEVVAPGDIFEDHLESSLANLRGGMIVSLPGHIGVPHLLAALGLSMLVFKAKWKACIGAGPRSIVFAALFVVGVFTLVVVSGR